MATSLVKVNESEVCVEAAKTVVNISICQESSLAYLVKAMAAAGQKWSRQKAPAPRPSTPGPSLSKTTCTGEQKVLGGVQILLGVMCLGLGGVLFLFNGYVPMRTSGAPFWMGSLFIVSGSLCVVSDRRGGCCWALLATFFNLASVVAGCVALATGVADVMFLNYTPYWVDSACGAERNYDYGWRPTARPQNYEKVEECRAMMRNLLNVYCGAQILLVVCCVAALGIALFCFGYGLRVLCCSLQAKSEDYVTIGDPEVPPPEVPPPYEEPAKENTAA
ncbi:transmembrane protein 176A-like isoform X2 [Paroedura picta]